MTDQERIARLEKLVAELAGALYRKDSEQDGNWGWPSTVDVLKKVAHELAPNERVA